MTEAERAFPMPICAVCGREVEQMIKWPAVQTDAITFEVKCHGEMEKMIFTALDAATAFRVERGVAFSKSKFIVRC